MSCNFMSRIIVIGNSHAICLQKAYQTRLIGANTAGLDISFIEMNDTLFQPNVNAGELNAEACRLLQQDRIGIVICMMGGNGYNAFGLLNHPIPFDFVLNEQPDLPLRTDAAILPFVQLRRRLQRQMVNTLNSLSALRKATDLPIFQLESPPPVPSEAHILMHPGIFGDRIDDLGVSPAVFRYKLWRVHTEIIKERCGEIGISFVPAPPVMQDKQGMMVAEAWNPDPTHGNELYGEHLFRQIIEIASSGAAQSTANVRKQPRRGPTYHHPYRNLPDHSYWRRAVSDVHPHEVDPVVEVPFKIAKSDRVATAGSCFAQHIARYLRGRDYNYLVTETGHAIFDDTEKSEFNYGVFTARFGNLYTARQLLQLFDRAYGRFMPVEDVWQESDDRFIDPFRPQVQPGGFASLREYRIDRAAHFQAVRAMFETLDVFVFTLGLTETYRSRLDGAVYPLCPGVAGGRFDERRHEFHNFSVDETVDDMGAFLERLRAVNPTGRVILTVSPVPLIATATKGHVLVSTTYSKSVLRVACQLLSEKCPGVCYFPSYEIITGNFSRAEYFAKDCRSVTEAGVDHVMRLFLKHLADDVSAGSFHEPRPITGEDGHTVAMERLVQVNCDEEALDA